MGNTARNQIETTVLLALTTGALWWAYFLGSIVHGKIFWVSLLFGFVPMMICWCLFFYFHNKQKPNKWSMSVLIFATLAFYPMLKQPWTPETKLLDKFNSIEAGMSDEEAQMIMTGHLGGKLRETSEMYLPEELRGKGVTHDRFYREEDTAGLFDADVMSIYLRDGVVVGTRFSPD